MNKQSFKRMLRTIIQSSFLFLIFSVLSNLYAQKASSSYYYSGNNNDTRELNTGITPAATSGFGQSNSLAPQTFFQNSSPQVSIPITDRRFFTKTTIGGKSSASAFTSAGAVLLVGSSVAGQPKVYIGDSQRVQYSISSMTGGTDNTSNTALADLPSNSESAKYRGAKYVIMGPSNQAFNISSPQFIYVYHYSDQIKNVRLPVEISNIPLHGGIQKDANFVLSNSGAESFILNGEFVSKPHLMTGYYQGTVDIIVEFN